MARRKNRRKPHLLTEATVKKFMKLANLNDLSGDFRQGMGYKDAGPEKSWEQPGLSRYKSHNHLLREQDEEFPPEDAALEPAGDLGDEAPPEDAALDAAPEGGGGLEAKVEDIVSAIADAIEEVVPEVSVDVQGGGAAPEEAPLPEPEAGLPPEAEPPMGDEEAALRETIGRAIREALLQQESLTDGAGNEVSTPSAASPDGKKDPAIEKGSMPDALSEQNGEGDSPEVEAVVDAIVDALEATTDVAVTADTSTDEVPPEAAEDGNGNGNGVPPTPEEDEAELARAMMEALQNRKTARRLVERVMKRASKEVRKGKKTISTSSRQRMRRAVRNNLNTKKRR